MKPYFVCLQISNIYENVGMQMFKSYLKVSKFQKPIFLFSFETKTKRYYFLYSALVSKMSQSKKMKALYDIN